MRESIGSTFMYNIIAIFIVVIFAILSGTLSYFKAFKVNNLIISSIEKYEGYNELAKNEIHLNLKTLGYRKVDSAKCQFRNNSLLMPQDSSFSYCVYRYCDEDKYQYHYGVTTFITIDFPVINSLVNVPVYTETSDIHIMDGWICNYDD